MAESFKLPAGRGNVTVFKYPQNHGLRVAWFDSWRPRLIIYKLSQILFKKILSFLGLDYRDALLTKLYRVVLPCDLKNQMNRI